MEQLDYILNWLNKLLKYGIIHSHNVINNTDNICTKFSYYTRNIGDNTHYMLSCSHNLQNVYAIDMSNNIYSQIYFTVDNRYYEKYKLNLFKYLNNSKASLLKNIIHVTSKFNSLLTEDFILVLDNKKIIKSIEYDNEFNFIRIMTKYSSGMDDVKDNHYIYKLYNLDDIKLLVSKITAYKKSSITNELLNYIKELHNNSVEGNMFKIK